MTRMTLLLDNLKEEKRILEKQLEANKGLTEELRVKTQSYEHRLQETR